MKKYTKIYVKIVKTLAITIIIFGLLTCIFLIARNAILSILFSLAMFASIFTLIIFPYKAQKRIAEKIFSQSQKIEIKLNWLTMAYNLKMLSETEKTFLELSNDNQKKFYLLKKENGKGYKLIILCEDISFVLYDNDPYDEWIFHFNKFYRIK